jgi:hypothetical protein
MAKRGRTAATAETSVGRCGLCDSTVEKSKMTRHIGACLRKAGPVSDSEGIKTFHIVVEGDDRPQYWMHLQLPGGATLQDLDSFLRDTWLECCGHLSEFTIEGKRYSPEPEDFGDIFFVPDGEDEEPPPEKMPEEEIQAMASFLEVDPELLRKIAENPPKGIGEVTPEEFARFGFPVLTQADIQAAAARLDVSPDALKDFVDKMSAAMEMFKDIENFIGDPWQLDDEDEESMDIVLEDVLSKGRKFRHEYDFGTTTELNLRVISEGYAQASEDNEVIRVLARNDPPSITCENCGDNEAELICPMCGVSMYGRPLCKKCARKHKCDRYFSKDMLLPVVNSPRAGLCGYTGEEED